MMNHKPIAPHAKHIITSLMIAHNISVVYFDAINNKMLFIGADTLSVQKGMSADMCALFQKWSKEGEASK